MTNAQTKQDIIEALRNRGEYFHQVDATEFRTRCPFCGDSENINTGHLYIRINPNDNLPIIYHCFRCPAKGLFTDDTLSALDISDASIKSGLFQLNKTSDKYDNKNLLGETENIHFDYELPEIHVGAKTKYIEDRIGLKLNDDDFRSMKVITSLKEFCILNGIKKLMCPDYIAYQIEDHFVGFLSYGNSHILFRDITENDKFRWIKYPITEKSKSNRIFYSIEAELDVMTTKPITINLAEGVFDTISICHNLGYNGENTLNISVAGKYYDRILLYLIDLGLVGSNITVNVFSDNDAEFNKKKNNRPTDLEYFKKVLRHYKYLYGEVNVYYNNIGKDYGVPRNKISPRHHRL